MEKKGLRFMIRKAESASCCGMDTRLGRESFFGRVVSLLISWAEENVKATKRMITSLILNGNNV